ncbi:Undecaprenyl-phosphate mannosyltransferase [Corynebacterium capitovis DSM 44611]|uniref:polyprenol monophosphomannose synthase n=1 Tax=Corynebacterium capitovis TaxID=131081 RepID=UPI0003686101|nr:polyprenol monophosphomannose synthase [Corynebacterium capitovis]WKD57689.1 Undecaprenyl-phosphate mannosyltransferase [Corynebacterium capitovis DSM 44611]
MANTTVVIIPTYNEVENLSRIVEGVLTAAKDAGRGLDILVVDDNSPDGTGQLADELATQHDEVHVVHRAGKEGLLAAYREGFRWALERDYEVVVQMDADGSHAPADLPKLLAEIDRGADLVIGSRYVPGGVVKDWPESRHQLSKWGNRYIGLALGDHVNDMTAGFRAFRREVLETVDLNALSPKGYIFQVDLAHRAIAEGFDVREVPITFVDRTAGESKLDAGFAGESFVEVTKWAVAEKSELIGEAAKEGLKLAQYEANHAGLWKLNRTIGTVPEKVVEALSEGSRLVAYELKRSPLHGLTRRAARVADAAVDMARAGISLGSYELTKRG